MSRPRSRSLGCLFFLIAAVIAHALGLWLMAEVGLMETLLASGTLEAMVMLPLAALFLALRLFVYVFAPGLALWHLGRFAWHTLRSRREPPKRQQQSDQPYPARGIPLK